MARQRAAAKAGLTVTRDPDHEAALVEMSAVPASAYVYDLERTSPSGTTVGVRGAMHRPTGGQATILVRDWEVPFGVSLLYVATFYDAGGIVVGSASANFQLDSDDCRAWLVDLARPTNSLPLVVESFAPLGFTVPAGVHRVLDRRAPIIVTLAAWTPEAELVVLTDTLDERDQVRNVFGSGYPCLLRTMPEQGVGNMYLAVTSFAEDRIQPLGTAQPRRFGAAVAQVERPDPTVFTPTAPNTYANVEAEFATYADMTASVPTYDALAYTFPTYEEAVAGIVPWLPDDV